MEIKFAGIEVGNRIDYLFDVTGAPIVTKAERAPVACRRVRVELVRGGAQHTEFAVESVSVEGWNPNDLTEETTPIYWFAERETMEDWIEDLERRATAHANSAP